MHSNQAMRKYYQFRIQYVKYYFNVKSTLMKIKLYNNHEHELIHVTNFVAVTSTFFYKKNY